MLLNLILAAKLSQICHEYSICCPAVLQTHQSTAPVAQGQLKAFKVSARPLHTPETLSWAPFSVCTCHFYGGFGGKKAVVMDWTQLSHDPLWISLK